MDVLTGEKYGDCTAGSRPMTEKASPPHGITSRNHITESHHGEARAEYQDAHGGRAMRTNAVREE